MLSPRAGGHDTFAGQFTNGLKTGILFDRKGCAAGYVGVPPATGKDDCFLGLELEKLEGTIEEIIYSNEDTGFTVCTLNSGEELISVVGELLGAAVGEQLVITGRYTTHPTYGSQFKAEAFERHLPAGANAILKYLSSRAIKGVGPALAARIVATFGDDTLAVLEKDPARLATVPGISPKRAEKIAEAYQQLFGIRTVMLYLSNLQVEPGAAIRAWKQWGSHTQEVVNENPYALCCEAVGVSFECADAIAAKLGLAADSGVRIRAGVEHILRHNLSNGHTCLPMDKLLSTTTGLLEVESFLVEEAIETAVEENSLVSDTVAGRRYLYLPELYEAETYVAGRINMMLITGGPGNGQSYDQALDKLEEELGLRYAQRQREAVAKALQSSAFILTGGPGTGKTTTLNAILHILEAQGEKVVLAAPTGRAAKRMSEVTGRDAKTIHRLLEVDFKDGEGRNRFKRNEKNPLRCTTIILDEVSMVDTMLFASLLRAMRLSCRLLLVGDPDQLPSVGAGNILRDLIESDCIPTVHLTEIFRQAQQSLIVENAHSIVSGQAPVLTQTGSDFFFLTRSSYEASAQTTVELCATRLPKAYGFSPLEDIQVVVPSRVGALGTVELNKLLQEHLNPPDPMKKQHNFGRMTLREGDKVMQVRNNYDIAWTRENGEQGAGVFNGDIGIIDMIDRPSQTILIRFEDRTAAYTFDMAHELEHAYAITVHKSQGSEYEAVVMPLMNFHSKLYYRNILYTAVTRAKKIMVILGQQATVRQMVDNHRKILRYTNLAAFLQESLKSYRETEADLP